MSLNRDRKQKDKCHSDKRQDKLEKFEKLDKLKVRDLCVKNLNAVDITTKTITGVTGTFDNLTANNVNINNLNATTINGRNPNCDNAPFNFSGVITPVSYVNGVPQQPTNPGNFNQQVLDDLWRLNVLANAVTNLDADSGRLRNAILNNFYGCTVCPPVDLSGCTGVTGPTRCSNQGYSVFTGSIDAAPGTTGTILTVTEVLDESLTDCPPQIRPIVIGSTIFLENTNNSFPTSTIVSQLSGSPGGTGTYLISNNFNNYSVTIPSQRMLSLSNLTTNECVNVPLRIYGVETLSVGPTGPCGNIISAIAYNINIANKTLNTRVAAVYVQVGWQPVGATGLGSVNIQGLSIDTRQFDPSILSFGEQMNNNVLLPTNLIERIAIYNRFSNVVNAVAQLVIYVEDGLEVLIPKSSSTNSSSISAARVTAQAVSSVNTNYAASFVPNDPGIILDPIPIPAGAKTVRFNAFGGGGGGGSGISFFNGGGGGGGGSGNDLGGEQTIDLTTPGNNYTSINVIVGRGGASDQDGGTTIATFIKPNGSRQFGAAGGQRGNTPTGFVAGDGGSGYYGGGGGGTIANEEFVDDPGKGGTGTASGSCPNGEPGTGDNETAGKGGNGGSLNCNSGGQGAFSGGGGGGGGDGGGNGGNSLRNGLDATGRTAGGGGAGTNASAGGKGADGYFIGPFFTF